MLTENGFTTLASAITTAGLNETLAGDEPFTIFAPTDEAFADLPEGALDALLADPAALAEVLKYHVLSEEVGSAALAEAGAGFLHDVPGESRRRDTRGRG